MYKLELNTEQAKIVVASLDFFMRIGMGQIEEVANVLTDYHCDYDRDDCENLVKVRGLCKDIKAALNIPHNGSYGIYNDKTPAICKAAYDIECVLRQTIAQQEDHKSYSTWLNDPLHANKEIPLAKCTYEDK
jgi:hypothetical protein